jgi:hypothetical protein
VYGQFVAVLIDPGYGYLWRRHTHRIEDGLEVERFVAADDDSDRPAMTHSHVDANKFVTAPGTLASRNSDPATSLGRRTSVIEPIGDNVYEPSVYPSNRYSSTYGGAPDDQNVRMPYTSADHRNSVTAYEKAASGEGGMERNRSLMRPTISRPGSRLSGGSYGYRSGVTSPVEDGRGTRDQYYGNG